MRRSRISSRRFVHGGMAVVAVIGLLFAQLSGVKADMAAR